MTHLNFKLNSRYLELNKFKSKEEHVLAKVFNELIKYWYISNNNVC